MAGIERQMLAPAGHGRRQGLGLAAGRQVRPGEIFLEPSVGVSGDGTVGVGGVVPAIIVAGHAVGNSLPGLILALQRRMRRRLGGNGRGDEQGECDRPGAYHGFPLWPDIGSGILRIVQASTK